MPSKRDVLDTKTGQISIRSESESHLFVRRSIRNMTLSDGVVIFDIGKKPVISQLIGYAVIRSMVSPDIDYSSEPFYYWNLQRVFVVNQIMKTTALNLRNFIIVNNISTLCVIGDLDTRNYPLISFFERVFRIRSDKQIKKNIL